MSQTVDSPLSQRVGSRIRRERRSRRWSQRELGARAQLGLQAISDIETGRVAEPKLSSLTRIAQALGVSLDVLAGDQPATEPQEEEVGAA